MSYLSTTENVGFSGIPQTISETSCATQYKMAVDGVSSNCSEVMYIPDSSADEQPYITHINDNFYSKFKIDPNELITFHDSDVIAGEITVSHTEDTFVFPESVDTKTKLDSPNKELDILGAFTNGDIKKEIKKKVLSNGHHPSLHKTVSNQKDSKTSITKAQKTKSQVKEVKREPFEVGKLSLNSTKSQTLTTPTSTKNSITSTNTNNVKSTTNKQSPGETFLDVFKREQGLVQNSTSGKNNSELQPLVPPSKTPLTPPKKSSSGKTQSQSKPRRGRGPAVHEALQRIPSQRRAIPVPNAKWHAPGANLFECGPLDNKTSTFRQLESSSSDDDNMPDFDSGNGIVDVKETALESRGARLALRRAALRRHVARAHTSLKLLKDHKEPKTLASIIKKQLISPSSSGNLPQQTVNHLLAMRGMPSILSPQERRKLREIGWSGGDSVTPEPSSALCGEDKCMTPALPCCRYCLAHVTLASEQRLYAPCAAVFAGGARCNQPLLSLREQTPLCAEHAWKRDNYDKLKDSKPKKVVRPRVCPTPRRPKRRRPRRAPPRLPAPAPPPPPTATQSLSEINVCSNSSTYDSAEETNMGALSDTEYITVPNDSHGLEVEVGHVAADDILDPAVLSQIPDEAFTEFFNQGIVYADSGSTFGEGSELAAALEAVLDERGLDERTLDEQTLDEQTLDEETIEEQTLDNMEDSMFSHGQIAKSKMGVSTSVSMEMSSNVSS